MARASSDDEKHLAVVGRREEVFAVDEVAIVHVMNRTVPAGLPTLSCLDSKGELTRSPLARSTRAPMEMVSFARIAGHISSFFARLSRMKFSRTTFMYILLLSLIHI